MLGASVGLLHAGPFVGVGVDAFLTGGGTHSTVTRFSSVLWPDCGCA